MNRTRSAAACLALAAVAGCTRDLTSPPNQAVGPAPRMSVAAPIGGWSSVASLPAARYGAGVAAVNGVIYAVGGTNYASWPLALGTMDAYDPDSNAWKPRAPMTTPRLALGVGVIGGILYAVGGVLNDGNVATPVLEAYNPVLDEWTRKADMRTARGFLGVGVLNGKLYAVGGADAGTRYGTVEVYDPITDSWEFRAPLPVPTLGLAVAVVNDTLYAMGGDVLGAYGGMYAYDPSLDRWTLLPDMPAGTMGLSPAATTSDGAIYAAGGYGTSYLGTTEAYDPGTGGWTVLPAMASRRYGLGLAVVNHVMYAVGGVGIPATGGSEQYLADVEALHLAAPVPNTPPSVAPIAGSTLLEGETFAVSGSFSDPDADSWLGTVDYGDATGAQALGLSGMTFSLSHLYAAAGTYTVTVSVADNHGASGSAQATVVVKTPAQAAQDLQAAIAALIASGALSSGNANALDAKLRTTVSNLIAGQDGAALNVLAAFINQVNALVRSGRLSSSDGQQLIDAANRIMTAV